MAAATLEVPIEEILELFDGPPPPRKRFTRADVEQMLELGLFADQRCELIDGDLIDKMGQNPPHAAAIRRTTVALTEMFGAERILVQAPIEVAAAERQWTWPEPDVALLAEARPEYEQRHPRGDELLVLVEVADTTVRQDAFKKRDIYARAGVPEYWVLALGPRRLIVHRHLTQGSYGETLVLAEMQEVSLGSHSIPVSRLLPGIPDLMPGGPEQP